MAGTMSVRTYTGRRPSTTPDHVDYFLYGRKVRINLARCHLAMCQKMLDIDLQGGRIHEVFAHRMKISKETLRRFFRGEQLGSTALNIILKGLDLRADQVLEEVPSI